LDEIFVGFNSEVSASDRANDSHGDGLTDSERVAHGEHDIAHLGRGRAAEFEKRQILGIHFEQGDIGPGIGADDGGLEFPAVAQDGDDFLSSPDDVFIGEQMAVRADEDTRTEAVFAALARRFEGPAEEFAKERILEERQGSTFDGPGDAGSRDVDHGGQGLANDRADPSGERGGVDERLAGGQLDQRYARGTGEMVNDAIPP